MSTTAPPSYQIDVTPPKVNYNPNRFSFARSKRADPSADSSTTLTGHQGPAPISGYGLSEIPYDDPYEHDNRGKVYNDPFAARSFGASDDSIDDTEHRVVYDEGNLTSVPYDHPDVSRGSTSPEPVAMDGHLPV